VRPGNPIYAIPNVPFVLALAMGSIYFLAMLVVVGRAWLKSSDRLFLLSIREEPTYLADGSAIAYGLTGVLYVTTATVIHHHAGAPALTWLGIVLWLHVIFTFWAWGMFRFPPLHDVIAMTMTSANLALYLGTKLFAPYISWLNVGQSVTMYVLEATVLVLLIWALIGPKGRARVTDFLTEDADRCEGHAGHSRSRGT